MKIKKLAAVALAFGLPALAVVAQNDGPPQDGPPGGPPGGPQQGPPDGMQGGPRRGPRRPPPPIIAALDTNRDGIIDADEIANAPAALKALLRPGSDHLTVAELLGPPPRRGMGPGGPGGGGPGQGPGPDQRGPGPGGPGGDQGPGGPPGAGPDDGPAPGGPAGRPGGGMNGRPLPPIIMALDANHDGVIDANEIANASAALKSLDKTGSGKIPVDQLMGRPPGGRGMGRGPGPGPGPGPDGGGPGGQN